MLSRVADSLYWLSQNIERADNMAKLLSVRLVTILENNDPDLGEKDNWEEIIEITSNKQEYLRFQNEFDRLSVIHYIAFSMDNANSIRSCITIARENAKMIREMIPLELWEVINDLYLSIKEFPEHKVSTEQLNDFFYMISEKSLLFQGVITSIMPRGEAYSFIMFGKFLERARKMARTLDVYYHKKLTDKQDVNYHYWSSVLSSVSGYESYLQKYQAFIDPLMVVNYLMFDESLPRSAKFCAEKLLLAFQQLENNRINGYTKDLYMKLHELLQEVSYNSLEQLNEPLSVYFKKIQKLCNDIGAAIMDTYYLGEIKTL